MKLLTKTLLVGVAAFGLSGVAHASIIHDIVTSNGLSGDQIQFNDDSAENIIDVDGDGFISAGDRFRGVFDFASIVTPGPTIGLTPPEINGIFELEVVSVVGQVITFMDAADLGAVTVQIYSSNTVNHDINAASLAAVEGLVTDGALELELGFGAGSFWTAEVNGAFPLGATSIAALSGISPLLGAFGNFSFALNILTNNTGLLFLDVLGTNQIAGNGQFFGGGGNANFDFKNSADVFVQAIPEPATLGLLGAGLLGLGLARRRKAA